MAEPTVPRVGRTMLAACAAAAGCLAAAHVGNVADAAHDTGVARAMGLAPAPWRALDAVVASALAWLPLGTRAARAELGQALVLAGAAAVLYAIARRIAAQCAVVPRLGGLVAAVATLAAVCTPTWQLEGAAVAGSATGALLVLLPLAVVAGADEERDSTRWRMGAFLLGLALGHEVLVGGCALLGCAVLVGTGAKARRGLVTAWKTGAQAMVASLLAGLAPWVLAMARVRAAGMPLAAALTDGWAGEPGASAAGSPMAFVRDELGTVLGALAVAGAVLAVRSRRSRALGAGLVAVTVAGFAAAWAGAALGPTRFGAPVLAAQAAACALAAVAMQAIVKAVADARLPAARASAAMVLLVLLVIPVDAADEALLRTLPRAAGAAAVWDDAAWGELPPRAVVLVTDARLGRRAAAAQAEGALRGDLTVVPVYARGVTTDRALASDAALVPLWRDLALSGLPSEASMSSLASLRPVVMAFEPRWGRVEGKHLVPVDLLDRFEPEPRGASDRKKALDAFGATRERLAKATAKDTELRQAAAYLLRARALDIATSGDHDLVGHAVDDLRGLSPDDPVGSAIEMRLAAGRGAGKVEDLRP